jgi:hypothetical protein
MSFVSQLYSAGVSGKVFTVCMHSPSGGGLLAFGEAVEPGLVYTPLLPVVNEFLFFQCNETQRSFAFSRKKRFMCPNLIHFFIMVQMAHSIKIL